MFHSSPVIFAVVLFQLVAMPFLVQAEKDPAFYGQTVVLPDGSSEALAETASELVRWLGEISGESFEITREATEAGIHLRLAAEDDSHLSDRGKEAFHLFSPAESKRLVITGNSEQAISHGVYFYLEQLGCRWLFPNDNWTIIPRRDSVRVEIDRVEEPVFRLRNFFGTGGFGGKLPVDPEIALQARWELWKKQNRFGGDIQLSGHSGEAFNHAHREDLEAHPEYFAEIDGKRQSWGVTTKLCGANPDVRKRFTEDRLAFLEKNIERFPDSPRSMSVSVEPADGGDHCECAECLKLGEGTISDRVFSMANEVAAALAQKHPDKYANLYAYNKHAAPPSFSVEPNVFVLVAPYAFQRTGLPGDELVKAWSPLSQNLGIYDYWAIPDWANCLPVFDYSTEAARKVRFWQEQNVSAFLGESSFSAGNVGLVWWLTGKLLWNPETDERGAIDEFFDLAFGAGKEPVRRMMERWASGFLLSEHELALSYRDLAEARSLAGGDVACRARIGDFVHYVEYLRLWRAYQETETDSADRIARADELIRYLWRIYPTAMVHSFRMYQLIAYRYERSNEQLLEKWPQKNAEAPAWKNLPPVAEAELTDALAAGVRDFTPLDFEPRSFSKELRPMHRPDSLSEDRIQTPQFSGTHDFEFWVPEEIDTLELAFRCGKRDNYPGNLILVKDSAGHEVFRHKAPSDGEWRELAIPISESGNYRMRIHDQKIFFAFRVPKNLPFVVKGWHACPALPSKVFFQVSTGIRRLAISQESVVPLKVTDADGKLIAHSDKKLFVVEVPANQSGKIWTLSDFKTYRPLRLLNAPNVFAFSEESLMIPVE